MWEPRDRLADDYPGRSQHSRFGAESRTIYLIIQPITGSYHRMTADTVSHIPNHQWLQVHWSTGKCEQSESLATNFELLIPWKERRNVYPGSGITEGTAYPDIVVASARADSYSDGFCPSVGVGISSVCVNMTVRYHFGDWWYECTSANALHWIPRFVQPIFLSADKICPLDLTSWLDPSPSSNSVN